MKRFWKEAAAVREDGGWGIALDGRRVRTPQRAPLVVASATLAEAIAAEWQAVGETIDPAAMPMTGLANASIDLASPDPAAFAETVAAYAATDLFCYRDDRDTALQAEQAAAWNPLLAWAEERLCVEFALTQGILPVDQPAETVAALRTAVFALDPWRMTALTPLVTIGGSLVAGLALAEAAFDPDLLWQAVSLDELYQERHWGADSEAQAQRAAHKRDWDNAVRFLGLL
ncbi:ATP12 family chaperone protein [Sphingopyxis macrogoltabida]|uniref:ATPase n=1 Tax=Sphingopyxis macrogoltabida TaxID=33050 RepID=A0AAC9AWB2_SPHMC|nr:ATP12 family protein [Sphingopyxis macrogoltabida]ALJ14872.1 ATPase [Sphingopyxis macrogoltabida]AMU91124.1 ATPase [Sphingopyxis macrogoltabida]